MAMRREVARAFMWGVVDVPLEPKPAVPTEMTEAEREKIRKIFNID